MQKAAHFGGKAILYAATGYVHTISHVLGSFYDISHGLSNANVLPFILDVNLEECAAKFARLSIICDLGSKSESEMDLAKKFVRRINELLRNIHIPEKMKELRKDNIPLLLDFVLKDVSIASVPKFLEKEDFNRILHALLME